MQDSLEQEKDSIDVGTKVGFALVIFLLILWTPLGGAFWIFAFLLPAFYHPLSFVVSPDVAYWNMFATGNGLLFMAFSLVPAMGAYYLTWAYYRYSHGLASTISLGLLNTLNLLPLLLLLALSGQCPGCSFS